MKTGGSTWLRLLPFLFLACLCSCGVAIFYPLDSKGKPTVLPTASPSPNERIVVSATPSSVVLGERATIKATGGKPPYQFTMVSGGGSVTLSDGTFIASSPAGVSIVRVVDADKRATDVSVLTQTR